MHLYGNSEIKVTTNEKPALKPKPKIGPMNGDVYSMVDPARSASPLTPAAKVTYMNVD